MPPKRSLPSKHRRKPFSHKQKKLQLQQKRHKKRDKDDDSPPPLAPSAEEAGDEREEGAGSSTETGSEGEATAAVAKLIMQPSSPGRYDPDKYKLHFQRESAEEIERRKRRAQTEPVIAVPEISLEVGVEDVYRPGSELDIPRRPQWTYSMTKQQLDTQEESMFHDYLSRIHSSHRPQELSHFEHNLETWRQLWRVLEISDVVLLITDVRHPTLHFSPALYSYVVDELGKKIVLVLNKVDLVPPQVAVAWRHYFLSKFPHLKVICFTCHPDPHSYTTHSTTTVSLKPKRRGRATLPSAAVGSVELFKVVEEMFTGKVDLASWRQQLVGVGGGGDGGGEGVGGAGGDVRGGGDGGAEVGGGEGVGGAGGDVRGGGDGGGGDSGLDDSDDEQDSSARQPAGGGGEASAQPDSGPASGGMITIGMVGHPNVGKSSILNGLMGKKMVSTSRTPGHTKHFQTIFLSRSVRLCDCPGLVFPSLVEKQLQILSGIYPVAQVREPYTAVGYLAERTPLTALLGLQHSYREEQEEKEQSWTAWDICDAWAEKRKFFTARAARTDCYRAANNILRMAVDGRVCMYFRPPGYSTEKGKWEGHPEVAEMIELQQRGLAAGRRVSSDHPYNLAVPRSALRDPREGGEVGGEEGDGEEEWESGDEGQWSSASEGGEGGEPPT